MIAEKAKKIQMLENEIARMGRMQDDLLLRERKYGERMLQLHVDEFMSIARECERNLTFQPAILDPDCFT